MRTRQRLLLLCALGITLLGSLATPTPALADSKTPCGFPLEGDRSDFVIGSAANGGKGLHDPAPTTGWDWWHSSMKTSDKLPIEVISMTSGSARIGTDVYGNTYIYVTNTDWTVLYMHLDRIDVSNGDRVKQGQILGLMGDKGNSWWTHLHLSIYNLNTGNYITTEKEFNELFDCQRAENPGGEEDPGDAGGGTEPPTDNSPAGWWNWLKSQPAVGEVQKVWDQAQAWWDSEVSSTPPTETPSPEQQPGETPVATPIPPRVYKFSISDQKPGDSDYQFNIRAFFAWPTSGENLNVMNQMDLDHFEGSWLLPPGTHSVNDFFGSQKYESGQGMRTPPSTGGIGDGSCNAASFVSYVLADSGIGVDRDDPSHAPVPGVPAEYVATVCIPTQAYPCSATKDVRVTHDFDYPVRLHWRIDGDQLSMWVEKVGVVTGPPSTIPQIPLPKWIIVALVILVLAIALRWLIKRKGHRAGEAVIWVANNRSIIVGMIKEAFASALQWWLFVFVFVVVLYEQIRTLLGAAFGKWIGGTTVFENWRLAVIGIAFLGNWLLRRYFMAKTIRNSGGYVVVYQPPRNRRRILIAISLLVVGSIVALSVDQGKFPPVFRVPSGTSPVPGTNTLLPREEMIAALKESNVQQPNWDNIESRYDEIVTRSVEAGVDPALTMSIWIEESGASNYALYPNVADFGCISQDRANFGVQLSCFLELKERYSTSPMFRECRGADNQLSLREFLLIYEGGFASCKADDFLAEPDFPQRLQRYYEILTGGKQLDF